MKMEHVPRTCRVRLAAAAVLLAGCSTATGVDTGAILRRSCAPADGPAVQLVVPASDGDFPQLRLWVWRSEVEGTTVTVPGPEGATTGTAEWCTAERLCQAVTTATAVFGEIRSDQTINVFVEARLPDGSRFRESRRAQWQGQGPVSPLCG